MHTERVYDVGTDEKKSLKELLEPPEMTEQQKRQATAATGSPTGKRPPNRTQKRQMEKDARRAKAKVDA